MYKKLAGSACRRPPRICFQTPIFCAEVVGHSCMMAVPGTFPNFVVRRSPILQDKPSRTRGPHVRRRLGGGDDRFRHYEQQWSVAMGKLIAITMLMITVGTPALAQSYETGNRYGYWSATSPQRRQRASIHERGTSVSSLTPCRHAAAFTTGTSTTRIPGEAALATIGNPGNKKEGGRCAVLLGVYRTALLILDRKPVEKIAILLVDSGRRRARVSGERFGPRRPCCGADLR